jgi:hypothetical protein
MPKAANRNRYASRVNILKYVKVAWRFAPVQLVNNKLKFDWVLIDGQPERHTEEPIISSGMRTEDAGGNVSRTQRKFWSRQDAKSSRWMPRRPAWRSLTTKTKTTSGFICLTPVAAYLKEMEPPRSVKSRHTVRTSTTCSYLWTIAPRPMFRIALPWQLLR